VNITRVTYITFSQNVLGLWSNNLLRGICYNDDNSLKKISWNNGNPNEMFGFNITCEPPETVEWWRHHLYTSSSRTWATGTMATVTMGTTTTTWDTHFLRWVLSIMCELGRLLCFCSAISLYFFIKLSNSIVYDNADR